MIYVRRENGAERPWTKDPILQTYRFCNIERENDTVTKWIARNWRNPWQEDPDLWFAMVVARNVNSPDSLEQLGYPVPWKPKRFYEMIADRQNKKLKIYNAAYMIVPRQTSMPKAEYLVERLFNIMWKDRAKLRPTKEDSLESFYERLSGYWGMGTFMTAQVIADLKYVDPLRKAPDWFTFAKSGPGSKRGMNRILGREVRASMPESIWYSNLMDLQKATTGDIRPILHAQDLQNALCEFDKYERVRLGEGVPKQRYK